MTHPSTHYSSMVATCAVTAQVLGVPMDRRIPKVRFATSNKNTLRGQRVVVRIHSWYNAFGIVLA